MNWKIHYIVSMSAARVIEECKRDLKDYQYDNSRLGKSMRRNALNDLINLKALLKEGTTEQIADYLATTCNTYI